MWAPCRAENGDCNAAAHAATLPATIVHLFFACTRLPTRLYAHRYASDAMTVALKVRGLPHLVG